MEMNDVHLLSRSAYWHDFYSIRKIYGYMLSMRIKVDRNSQGKAQKAYHLEKFRSTSLWYSIYVFFRFNPAWGDGKKTP